MDWRVRVVLHMPSSPNMHNSRCSKCRRQPAFFPPWSTKVGVIKPWTASSKRGSLLFLRTGAGYTKELVLNFKHLIFDTLLGLLEALRELSLVGGDVLLEALQRGRRALRQGLLLRHQRVGDELPLRGQPLLHLLFPEQKLFPRVRFTQFQLLRRIRLLLARVVVSHKVAKLDPRFLRCGLQAGHDPCRGVGGPRVKHGPSVPIPRVVAASVVHEDEVVAPLVLARRLRVQNVPVVLVVQVLVIVVEEDPLLLLVLDKPLHSVALQKLTVGLDHPPVQFCIEQPGLGRLEEMNLARESVEDLVEPRGNVPPPLKRVGVELGDHGTFRGHRPGVVVRPLRHALLLAHGAVVELADHLVIKRVSTLDLAR
mmetsp:Transcript_51245/g.87842  ORF Transcript_51245/g.87842 Transcript_51245/m.87842 type:complete len:368 (+) Transcript_51245:125-1228(+)